MHEGFSHQWVGLKLIFLIQFHGGNSFKLLHERPNPFNKRDSNLVKLLVEIPKGIIKIDVSAEGIRVSNIEQGNVSNRWEIDKKSACHIVRIAFCLLIVISIRSTYCNHDNMIFVRLHQLWVDQLVKESIFFNNQSNSCCQDGHHQLFKGFLIILWNRENFVVKVQGHFFIYSATKHETLGCRSDLKIRPLNLQDLAYLRYVHIKLPSRLYILVFMVIINCSFIHFITVLGQMLRQEIEKGQNFV